jgi:glycosyltransferase involved in cell wall biosynthesis
MPADVAEAAVLRGEVARLAAENARLRAAAAHAADSAAVQALRAGAQLGEAHGLRMQLRAMRGSLFWRLTLPLRIAVDFVRGAPAEGSPEAVRLRRAVSVLRREGPRALSARVLAAMRRERRTRVHAPPVGVASEEYPAGAVPPPNVVLAPLVVIIAELTLPQCAKYRVWQKQAHFARLGVPCVVVNWHNQQDCLSAAALATFAILYRVPAFPPVLRLIDTLKELRVPVAWEVDDLIFDTDQFLQNRNVDTLDPALREGVLSGVDLYRNAMLACGRGIASTPHLADAMRAAGLEDVTVVENALDAETLALANDIRAARRPHDGVLIGYGSGTKTHDADFREAVPALVRVMAARPEVRLRVVGELNLPPALAEFGARVEHLPPASFARYLGQLGDCDINIAPLEPTLFNDAKSNIKFLEAAILELPSVCSPAANFTALVSDDETGLLASGEDSWFAALDRLAGDAALRARLGRASHRAVLDNYAPEAIARDQVAPLLRFMPDERPAGKMRVLFANVYYAPRSYGGATLVVEELAHRLHARPDTEVYIVTALPHDVEPRRIVRREQDGITVFELPVMAFDPVGEFDDPLVGDLFGQVLEAVQPDVVHLHSVQWLSASLATACRGRDIPYLITMHDAWWVCARQFMVREDGTYCHQTSIDLRVCQNCLPGARHLQKRQALLRAALDGAAMLISPSEAHKALYVANGIAPDRIRVMPNGVRLPLHVAPRVAGRVLRFAYVGGNVEVKGFSVVRRAFEALERGDWELTLVDNTLNLGFSSVDAAGWRVRGTIRTVPAYTQTTIDEFFAGVDVLLFPSQWKESFGLTVREALARNVWVIATGGGGPADAIAEGENGNLIALDGRPEGLTRAISALLDDRLRLVGYENPYRNRIGDFDAQADDLHALLAQIAGQEAVLF